MNILYLSYDGMTDPLGQSQVLPYLTALSAKGYKFTIVSFEKKDRYQKEGPAVRDIISRSGINWQPLFYTRNPPILSKIYDRWQMKQHVKKLQRQHRFSMVHCRSYIAAEMGLWLKRKFNISFLFDMRGFWADEKVDCGQWNQDNPFFRRVYRHYKKKEKEFLLEADAIISLTYAARKELHSKPDYRDLQIDVIPCCADLAHFNYQRVTTQQSEGLRQELGISANHRVITYLGSVGGWYMTKEMFAFYKRLLIKYPDFVLLLMTKDDPAMVRQQLSDAGIPSEKVIIQYAVRKDLPVYISLGNCSIFFIRPTYSKIASSPTKHAELMGMGIPVICNDIGDTGEIIERTNTGVVVPEFTDKSYDEVVEKMNTVLATSKEHIRQSAFQYFDLEKGVDDYLQVYKRVLNN